MTRTKATTTKSGASAKNTASPTKKTKAPAKKATAKNTGTRTSSRSAKRRSPKTGGEDAELLEYERLQFLKAMDAYKRRTEQTFPSWSEVLDVIRSIGWLSPARLSSQQAKSKPLV